MAFENSPKFDSPTESQPSTLKDRMYKNRKKWIRGGIIFAVVWLLAITALFLMTSNFLRPPGGAEGYIATVTGEPADALLTIGNVSQRPYDDGYFFFAEVPPGEYEMIIETTYGIWREPVTIISGQAVDMGKIVLRK